MWFLSAQQKSAEKMQILGISELLVRICKKRAKTRHFIWGFCAIWGLPISIWSIFDRIVLDFIDFDGWFDEIWWALLMAWNLIKSSKIEQKRTKKEKWRFCAIWWKTMNLAYNRLNMAYLTLFYPILALIKAHIRQ